MKDPGLARVSDRHAPTLGLLTVSESPSRPVLEGALELAMVDVLTVEAFQRIKQMILRDGDRRTYCNMYNNNPHIELDGFHAYLDPVGGQRNINCDPELSDFDELVIQDWRTSMIYFRARVKGDRLAFDADRAAELTRYFTALLARVHDALRLALSRK